jgi:hypothetical protein
MMIIWSPQEIGWPAEGSAIKVNLKERKKGRQIIVVEEAKKGVRS